MIQMEREWIAVNRNDRILERAETKAEIERIMAEQEPDQDYKIVAIPKVNPPQLI